MFRYDRALSSCSHGLGNLSIANQKRTMTELLRTDSGRKVRVRRPSLALARKLAELLPAGEPNLFHPWKDHCPEDLEGNGPEERLGRLAQHLDGEVHWILCGEAPGYQGCRYSGVAFTSERLIMSGEVPRLSSKGARLTRRRLPYSEPSATTVWRVLHQLGIAENTLLWNAVQLHPHKNRNSQSNRTPKREEVDLGVPALRLLRTTFPQAAWIAVGRTAEASLARCGLPVKASVRHPSFGGAPEFEHGMRQVVRKRVPTRQSVAR